MLRVNNVDLSPRRLLQNLVAPQGPIPPPNNASGSAESQRIAGRGLINATIRQVAAGKQDGVGGRIDLLG